MPSSSTSVSRARLYASSASACLPGAVEGEHELPAQPLAQRVLGDEGLELADELGMAAELELGVDQLLPRRRAELLEPRHLDAARTARARGRRAAARARARAPRAGAPSALGVSTLGRLRHEPLEAVQVDLLGLDVQDVARLASANEIAAERLAQIRDQVLNRPDRGSAEASRPQLFDQAVCRDHLACMEQEQGQEGALLRPPQLERPSLHPDLERAQDAELDPLHLCRFTTGRRRLLAVV